MILRGDYVTLILLHAKAQAPTPYAQEEVRFRNDDLTLAGTLLIPPTKGRHPAVVLIHESSTPSRNDFRFYADLFARRGIARSSMTNAPVPTRAAQVELTCAIWREMH